MKINTVAVEVTRPIKHEEYQYGKVTLRLEGSLEAGDDVSDAIDTLTEEVNGQLDDIAAQALDGKRRTDKRKGEISELIETYNNTRSKKIRAKIREELKALGVSDPDEYDDDEDFLR